MKEAEIHGATGRPDAGAVLFAEYATAWVSERPNLRAKTKQLYEGLIRLHLVPVLGKLAVADVKEGTVRRRRTSRLDSGSAWSRWPRRTGCSKRS